MTLQAQNGRNLQSFKAYDIRGRVPEQLNDELAQLVGEGMSTLLQPGPVVLGRDVRHSSKGLQDALALGFRGAGHEVIDIGLCGTEEVYFQTAHLGAAGGVVVTASHNPADYNGMKLVREQARPISGDSGLSAIRDYVAVADCNRPAPKAGVRTVLEKDAYIQHLLTYVDRSKLKPLKLVVNAGNGCAGPVIDLLDPLLPFEFVSIQHRPDGNFPNGIPNPLLPDHRSVTTDAVRAHQADFGIAWDGDFDRCFFFDGDGRFIEGYYVVGLLAQAMLVGNPGGKIIHDPRLVWNTIEMVRDAGGVPIMSKTGHAFIKERMRAENAIYGGEMSAHHYFRDFSYCDSGMIPWLLIAGLVSSTGISLAELVEERIKLYPCSGEINFKVADTDASTKAVVAHFGNLSPNYEYTDGISADFGEWRFNLRSSNTEPLLRLNVESRGSINLVRERTEEISALLGPLT